MKHFSIDQVPKFFGIFAVHLSLSLLLLLLHCFNSEQQWKRKTTSNNYESSSAACCNGIRRARARTHNSALIPIILCNEYEWIVINVIIKWYTELRKTPLITLIHSCFAQDMLAPLANHLDEISDLKCHGQFQLALFSALASIRPANGSIGWSMNAFCLQVTISCHSALLLFLHPSWPNRKIQPNHFLCTKVILSVFISPSIKWPRHKHSFQPDMISEHHKRNSSANTLTEFWFEFFCFFISFISSFWAKAHITFQKHDKKCPVCTHKHTDTLTHAHTHTTKTNKKYWLHRNECSKCGH